MNRSKLMNTLSSGESAKKEPPGFRGLGTKIRIVAGDQPPILTIALSIFSSENLSSSWACGLIPSTWS